MKKWLFAGIFICLLLGGSVVQGTSLQFLVENTVHYVVAEDPRDALLGYEVLPVELEAGGESVWKDAFTLFNGFSAFVRVNVEVEKAVEGLVQGVDVPGPISPGGKGTVKVHFDPQGLPPGRYTVLYRVDAKAGGAIVSFLVKGPVVVK